MTIPRRPARLRRSLVLAIALGGAFAVSGCDVSIAGGMPSAQVQGSGDVTQQARAVGGFDGVALALPGQVEVQSGAASVSIETEANLLPLIETVVEDGTLHIRAKKGTAIRTRHLKVTVRTPALARLSVGGSGSIEADRVQGERMQLDLGGSGAIAIGQVDGARLAVSLGGSGGVKAGAGSVRSLSVSFGGSGKVDLGRVRSETASVSMAGSGDATLWVRDSLDINAVGSGDLAYYGNPRVDKTSIGSGSLRRLGGAPR